MKKIALISSYCDTQEKLNILEKNITTLQKLKVDVMVLSPIMIPNNIVNLCDFYFKTKENPILRWPVRAHTFWLNFKNKNGDNLFLHRDVDDYSWAALYQTKKLSELSLTYEYDIFYHMIYDLNIDNSIINDIEQNITNRTYHRVNPKNNNEIWNTTLHFMSLDRQNLKDFADKIIYNDYVSKNGFAEHYIESILNKLNLSKSEFSVSDNVRYIDADDKDIFNYSKNKKYKIFFSRLEDKFCFVVYHCEENYLTDIILNRHEKLKFDDTIPMFFDNKKISSFKIINNDGTEDEYSEIINNIVRNVTEIQN
jgi:hypothetical protein